jgi:leader peptidase (prepilin peptidase)/N-methyltransferase
MLGFGDVKAMYAVGAAFGPLESLVAIFAACVSGIVTVALAGRLQRGAELRFGPHLAVGAVVALVAGAPIARYLGAT